MKSAKVLISFAALACGCATGETVNDHVRPESPSWYSRPSGSMSVTFRRQLTANARKVGEEYERGKAEIDPFRGRVFVGTSDRGLYALRAGDGSPIWRFETLGIVQSEPKYDPDLDVVYFGSHDGALYCVKAQTGELVYRFDTGAEVQKRPAISGETLLVANAADYLFAIDRRTGKPRWQVHRTPALGMEVSGYAGPSVDGNSVYIAYSDGHVAAYDLRDGAEKWPPVDLSADAEQQSGEAPRYLDVDTTPIVDVSSAGKALYVASFSGGVYALDAATGSRLWSNTQVQGTTDLLLFHEKAHFPNPRGKDKNGPPLPERKILIASSTNTGLAAIDPLTGKTLWRNAVPEGGISAPVAISGALMVGTTRYGLFLLSPRNGRVIDAIDTGTGISQVPATMGSRAYALSNTGVFVGITVEPALLGARRDVDPTGTELPW